MIPACKDHYSGSVHLQSIQHSVPSLSTAYYPGLSYIIEEEELLIIIIILASIKI